MVSIFEKHFYRYFDIIILICSTSYQDIYLIWLLGLTNTNLKAGKAGFPVLFSKSKFCLIFLKNFIIQVEYWF